MKKLFLLFWLSQVLVVSAQQNPDLEKPLATPDSSREASATPAPKANIIDIHQAWRTYIPPSFDNLTFQTAALEKSALEDLLMKDMDLLLQQRLGPDIRRLNQLIALDSMDVKALNELGVLYSQNGFYEKGRLYFMQALHRDSTFCFSINNLGNIEFEKKEFEAAQAQYKLATIRCSSFALPYYNLSLVMFQLKNLDQSDEYYQKAISLDPSLEESISSIGTADIKEGETKKAAEAANPHPQWAK